MARSVNKVILIGNLGNDPELRYTGSGTAVCTLSIATNERYKDSSDEWVEKTEWHRVVAWARLAEICGEYLKKGSRVYIEGSLQTRSWEDQDGNTRYTTEIKVRDMMMLDGRGDMGDGYDAGDASSYDQSRPVQRPAAQRPQQQARPQQARPQRAQQQRAPQQQDDFGGFEPDDDLPF